MRRECMRSYSTPMQKNMAPDTKPCEIICTMAPSMPAVLKMKKPRVTKPMCATDEYATSFFMSSWPMATRPDRKRGGYGKSVSVRVDLGGPRILKKKKTKK